MMNLKWKQHKKIFQAHGPTFWDHVKIEHVDQVPGDVDRLKH